MKCQVIKIITPKKYILNGLYFGPDKAKNVIVHTHGLNSSVFSGHDFLLSDLDQNCGVVFFNNRGHETLSKTKKIINKKGDTKSKYIGGAREKFVDCIDDIAGAINFAKEKSSNIFLSGHSTGCQKTVYYLSKNQKDVKGLVLLSPVSDYAGLQKELGSKKVDEILEIAKTMIDSGNGDQLIDEKVWPEIQSANRFLSLNTIESEEEIFTYSNNKTPKVLQKIKVPTLIVLGEKDCFRDRPMSKIAKWFDKNTKMKIKEIFVIKNADHGFSEKEIEVNKLVNNFINSL